MGSGETSKGLVLDLRGLKCPLPVMRTRKALATARPGQRLLVETTDPLAAIDIPNLCRESGHRLIAALPQGTATRFEIEVCVVPERPVA